VIPFTPGQLAHISGHPVEAKISCGPGVFLGKLGTSLVSYKKKARGALWETTEIYLPSPPKGREKELQFDTKYR
jgi:hypothetical protein